VRARLVAIGLSLLFTALIIGGFSLIVIGTKSSNGWLTASGLAPRFYSSSASFAGW